MKIIIRWNYAHDDPAVPHQTTTVETGQPLTSAQCIVQWLQEEGRTPETVRIHDISVDGFAQKLAGRNSGRNMTPEQRRERALKAVAAREAKKKARLAASA